jgi:TRAP-type C4-dicarboxylate transport system permease small subunit
MGATTSSVSSTDSSRTIQSYLRIAFAALLAWLTWGAFHDTYGNVPIVSDVSTAIHEFGHMLFMPFGIPMLGRTMVILGGSLTEVAFPLVFVGYFMRKREDGRRRDLFGAMVCLWWSGIGLLATAIYCADSRAGKLMLLDGLTGQESEGHDWYNLLDRWGLLDHDTQIARWMRMIAFLMCVASLAVAAWAALAAAREQPAD